MTELEQALGRLPEDPVIVPVPFPAIVERAARRRRRRWQGGGAAALVGLVVLVLGVTALISEQSPQVVDTASSRGGEAGLPATGGVTPTPSRVVAEGDIDGEHWRLLVRPGNPGLCLDVEYRGRTSSQCDPGVGAERAIAGALSSGLESSFVTGFVRRDVTSVRVELDRGDMIDVAPVGANTDFDVNFFVSPVAPDRAAIRAFAFDPAGTVLGEAAIGPSPGSTPSDELAAPIPPTTLGPEARVPPTTPATDPDGSVSSPIQPVPSEPIVPPDGDPTLTACPPADVAVTVTTGKASYAMGETVTGSSVLENRSSTACLVPARVRFAVQDLAGHDVSGFAYTADYALPVKAEPGQSFPGTFTWNQNNCSMPVCTPVPAGTYVLVGRWSEGGSFSAQASFQVGP